MPGCCVAITENMPPICENWDAGERRNFLASVVSGSLVGVWPCWGGEEELLSWRLIVALGHIYHPFTVKRALWKEI